MSKPVSNQRVINVGVNALAREVGQSPATVSKKLKAGQTPDQVRAAAARKQGRAMTQKKGHSRGPGTAPRESEYDLLIKDRARGDEIEHWKLRRAKALAERQEVENMLRRGELVPVSYVRTWGVRFLTAGRDELMKAPGELADTLAAESDPHRVAAALRTWVERAMAKFAQTESLWTAGENAQVA